MKRFCQYLFGAALAITISFDASALTITPTGSTPPGITAVPLIFSGPSNTGIVSVVDAYLSGLYSDPPDLAYKQNFGGSEEGGLAPSYSTVFNLDASGGTIKYDSGPAFTGPKYLLVKDGNFSPYAYFFDLTSAWNGTEDLVLENFWPGQGSISYVGIYAADGGTTLMLLGMALAGLGAARRFCRPSLS